MNRLISKEEEVKKIIKDVVRKQIAEMPDEKINLRIFGMCFQSSLEADKMLILLEREKARRINAGLWTLKG
jgi:hypothetical protein